MSLKNIYLSDTRIYLTLKQSIYFVKISSQYGVTCKRPIAFNPHILGSVHLNSTDDYCKQSSTRTVVVVSTNKMVLFWDIFDPTKKYRVCVSEINCDDYYNPYKIGCFNGTHTEPIYKDIVYSLKFINSTSLSLCDVSGNIGSRNFLIKVSVVLSDSSTAGKSDFSYYFVVFKGTV